MHFFVYSVTKWMLVENHFAPAAMSRPKHSSHITSEHGFSIPEVVSHYAIDFLQKEFFHSLSELKCIYDRASPANTRYCGSFLFKFWYINTSSSSHLYLLPLLSQVLWSSSKGCIPGFILFWWWFYFCIVDWWSLFGILCWKDSETGVQIQEESVFLISSERVGENSGCNQDSRCTSWI